MSEGKTLREIYLVRHAQSDCNVDGYIPESLKDKMDPALTQEGLEQAEKAGKYLSRIRFDAVYSSGLRRAAVTAAEIALYQKKAKSVIVEPDLCEIGIDPAYPGLSMKELQSLVPWVKMSLAEGYEKDVSLVIPDPFSHEQEERYFARAEKFLRSLERYNNGEKIAVVSHAGMLTYIIFSLIGYKDVQPSFDFHLSNTGVTKIRFYEPGSFKYGDMVFRYINKTSHLD